MFYRFSAQRAEITQTVQGLLKLKSDSIGIVQRLEALFAAARTAKVDVFAGDETYHKRWRSLLKGLEREDRERLLTNYIGADKLDEYDPSCLSPANVTEFVECEDGDKDGQPLGWISNFLQKRLNWAPLTPPRLQGAELRAVLAQLGEVHEVPLGKNKNSVAVLLNLAKVKTFLGVENLAEVFARVEGLRQKSREKNGFIVDVDLYQQRALLAAIVAKEPRLKDVFGFYNLQGSRKLYEVLSAQGFCGRTGIYWVWTGEKHVPDQAEDAYPEPEILTLDSIGEIRDGHFVCRCVDSGRWNGSRPADRVDGGGVVLGGRGWTP